MKKTDIEGEIQEVDKEVSIIKEHCYNINTELKPLQEMTADYEDELQLRLLKGRHNAINYLKDRVDRSRSVTLSLIGHINSILSSTDRINRAVEEVKKKY